MLYTIYSRKLHREVTFSRPGRAYVFVDLNGQSGTLGLQICEGGGLRGDTITYSGEEQQAFEACCQRWWRAYRREA